MKVALVTNMLSPYRVPLLNQIQRQSTDDWRAFFMYGSLSDRSWPDRAEALEMPGTVLVEGRSSGPVQRVLAGVRCWRALQEFRPDVVVTGGYVDPANWAALAWAGRHGVPSVLWMATWGGSRFRGDALSVLLSRRFVHACDAFVAYSSRAADYVEELGGRRDRCFVGPNVGDVLLFRNGVERQDEERGRGAPARLLYVGVLDHRKGVDRLLDALARLPRRRWTLRLVGSGPEREALEAAVVERGWSDRVRFVPQVAPEELLEHYGASDVFVLPSRNEPGAIVLGEALHAGLWLVVSDVDGVAPDLVTPGVNGVLVDAGDGNAFARALDDAMERVESGALTAGQVRDSVEGLDPSRYARAFMKAVAAATPPDATRPRA